MSAYLEKHGCDTKIFKVSLKYNRQKYDYKQKKTFLKFEIKIIINYYFERISNR